jgi:hypothetical protein
MKTLMLLLILTIIKEMAELAIKLLNPKLEIKFFLILN